MIIIGVIFLLIVVWFAVRRAAANKVEVCPRCNGNGYLSFGEEDDICYRCNGTGQMVRR